MDEIRRGERGKQETWQWLMALTAQWGLCVYHGRSAATTIDHEKPITDTRADVWWNCSPACEDCNREGIMSAGVVYRRPLGDLVFEAMR